MRPDEIIGEIIGMIIGESISGPAAGNPAFPGATAMPPADLPPCPHRYYSAGRAAKGGNIPPFAVGAYFPGDEPGFRCEQTLEMCSDFPPDCPEWKEAAEGFVCPACLEYGGRQGKNPFRERRLLAREGEFFCPECSERYDSPADLARAAIMNLRAALDDGDYLKGLVRGFERELGVSRHGRRFT